MNDFKWKAQKHFEDAYGAAVKLRPTIEKLELRVDDCQQGPEIYVPILNLANLHNEIVEVDQKMVSLEEDLKPPVLDKNNTSDIEFIKTAFQSILTKYCGSSLIANVLNKPVEELETASNESDTKARVPSILRSLQNAAVENDVEKLKGIIENPKIPQNSLKYIINYRFQDDVSDAKSTDCSLLMLACKNKSTDVMKYLIGLGGADLMETFNGETIVHQLLLHCQMEDNAISVDVEQCIEELFKMEPKLVHAKNANGCSMMEVVKKAKSEYLCRLLVEKYDFTKTVS